MSSKVHPRTNGSKNGDKDITFVKLSKSIEKPAEQQKAKAPARREEEDADDGGLSDYEDISENTKVDDIQEIAPGSPKETDATIVPSYQEENLSSHEDNEEEAEKGDSTDPMDEESTSHPSKANGEKKGENDKSKKKKKNPTSKKRKETAEVETKKAEREEKNSKHRKPYRHKPGFNALRMIKKLQKSTDPLIPTAVMRRIIRSILQYETTTDAKGFRIQREVVPALREYLEMLCVNRFSDALLCAVHCRRVTVMKRDLDLMQFLREQQRKNC